MDSHIIGSIWIYKEHYENLDLTLDKIGVNGVQVWLCVIGMQHMEFSDLT